MGFSGMKGKVQFVNNHCPVDLQGTAPVGSSGTWHDEVTRFTIVESANKKEYGHDKSKGWQDICYGIRRWSITLDCTVHHTKVSSGGYHAGQIVYLELYEFGTECSAEPMAGYAGIDQISKTVDQERGDPVAYTMTLSSKGRWMGMPGDGSPWGGFECECAGGDGSAGDPVGSDTEL